MIKSLLSTGRSAAVLACVLAAGCAGKDVAPLEAGKSAPVISQAPPSAPVAAPAAAATAPAPTRPESKPDTRSAASPAPVAIAPAKKPAPVKEAAVKEPAAKAEPAPKKVAPAKAESKTAAAKPAAAEPARSDPPAPVARKQEPTLDVAGLTARLGETKAIGVFTKLALKNQMDDLLDRFRAVYQGGQKSGVAALRAPFEALVGKVVTQLRPGDPSLARTIEGSREAIWGILSDPEKFKSVT
jgi:hypothetical protein